MKQSLVGVYRVGAAPWVLVEIAYEDVESPLAFREIAVPEAALEEANWQVPYEGIVLDSAGEEQLGDRYDVMDRPELLIGNFRLCFFLYRNTDNHLLTPLGELALGAPGKLPSRLAFIEFEEP